MNTAPVTALIRRWKHSAKHDTRIAEGGEKSANLGDEEEDNADYHSPDLPGIVHVHRSQQGHEDDDGDCVHRKRQLPTGTGDRNKREIVVFQLISPKKIAIAEASSRLRVGATLKHGMGCVLIKSCLPIYTRRVFPFLGVF